MLTLKDRELRLLALVLDLLGCSVNLLLALLGTTTEAEDEMEGRFLWLTMSAMYSPTHLLEFAASTMS